MFDTCAIALISLNAAWIGIEVGQHLRLLDGSDDGNGDLGFRILR